MGGNGSGRRRVPGALKGLQRVDGGRRIYHRATGRRMPDLPETDPAFLRAYLDAEQAAQTGAGKPARRARRDPGSVAAIWDSLSRSAYFRALSDNYRRAIIPHGETIAQAGAGVPVAQLRPRHIRADLATLDPHPAANRLKAWRLICAHALAAGLIDADPARAVRRPKAPAARSYPRWPAPALQAFRACWPLHTPQRLAFELLHYTGARIVDACTLGPPMITPDGWLHYTQAKTGQPVWIPWTAPLPPFVAPDDRAQVFAALDACAPSGPVWMTTQAGRPRSSKAASHWISSAARAAGLPADLTAHGLRVTRASLLADAGASARQVGAWTGHVSLSETDHYTRQADRRALLRGD